MKDTKTRDLNKNLYLKYKTAICRHYEMTGTCQLGKMCNFAHGSEEKRNINDVSPLSALIHPIAHAQEFSWQAVHRGAS
ncbi:MAG: zinc finger CCCH domain-containing protein [bacterium]